MAASRQIGLRSIQRYLDEQKSQRNILKYNEFKLLKWLRRILKKHDAVEWMEANPTSSAIVWIDTETLTLTSRKRFQT